MKANPLLKPQGYQNIREIQIHNPTCMERLEPKKGEKTIKCPTCGMEYRIAWVKDGFPESASGLGK